jgi:Holliday junction resolvasome RuvABC endonuclease subunit
MKNKIILSLDLGTKTGWAIYKNGHIISGVQFFQTSRFCGGGMRFLNFVHFLDKIHRDHGITIVVYEEVRRHKGVDAAHCYGSFCGHLSCWCEINKIPYQGVGVGTIKKHITGIGNAGKQEVQNAVEKKGFSVKDDNEADALALLFYAIETIYS